MLGFETFSNITQALVGTAPAVFTGSTPDTLSDLLTTGYLANIPNPVNKLVKYQDRIYINYQDGSTEGRLTADFQVLADGISLMELGEFAGGLEQNGMAMVSSTTTTMQFTAGSIDGLISRIIVPVETTVNLAVNGLNGLDTGTLAANENIFVYAINDSTGANPSGYIASTSVTGPLLPAGYDDFAFVYGIFTINASATLPAVRTHGENADGLYTQLETIIAVLSGGTSATPLAVDLTTPVRGAPQIPGLLIELAGQGSAAGTSQVRPTGSTSTTMPWRGAGGALYTNTGPLIVGINGSSNPSIDYEVSAGNLTLWVIGWTMSV